MEYLLNNVLWVLAVFGASNIIVHGKIFSKFREALDLFLPIIGSLVNCVMCMGFWVGILFSVFVYSPSEGIVYHSTYYTNISSAIFDGALGSATSWLLFLLIKERQKNT